MIERAAALCQPLVEESRMVRRAEVRGQDRGHGSVGCLKRQNDRSGCDATDFVSASFVLESQRPRGEQDQTMAPRVLCCVAGEMFSFDMHICTKICKQKKSSIAAMLHQLLASAIVMPWACHSS